MELPLKDIIQYREIAFIEIKLEAKSYQNQQKDSLDDQNFKPLLDIWSNVINNEDVFKTKKPMQHVNIPIKLCDIEQVNLYELLELDKSGVLLSYLNGELNNPEQLMSETEISIASVYLILTENSRRMSPSQITCIRNQIKKNCQCKKCREVNEGNSSYFKNDSDSDSQLIIKKGRDSLFLGGEMRPVRGSQVPGTEKNLGKAREDMMIGGKKPARPEMESSG